MYRLSNSEDFLAQIHIVENQINNQEEKLNEMDLGMKSYF